MVNRSVCHRFCWYLFFCDCNKLFNAERREFKMKRIFLLVDKIAMKWIIIIGILYLGFALFGKPIAALDIEPRIIGAAKRGFIFARSIFANTPEGIIRTKRTIWITNVEYDKENKRLVIKSGAKIVVENE